MPAPNPNRFSEWDTLLTSTTENVRDSFQKTIWNGRPLHRWLFDKGRRRMIDGGTEIVEPLLYAGSSVGWHGENDLIEIAPSEGLTAASFPWAAVYAPMYISAHEKLKNSGKEQRINLVSVKVEQAMETMKENLSVVSFKDTPGTGEMFGLGALINDAAGDLANSLTGASAVGGIDTQASAAPWWESFVYDGTPTTGDFGAAGLNSGEAVRKAIRTARNESSDSGSDRVDAAFTDLATYEAVEDSYQANVQYEDVDSADSGFENVLVSKLPLFWDFHCTAATVFGINSKYLQIVGHQDRFMETTPWSKDVFDPAADGAGVTGGTVGQFRDGQYAMTSAFLQMTTRNRRRHFRINNVSL